MIALGEVLQRTKNQRLMVQSAKVTSHGASKFNNNVAGFRFRRWCKEQEHLNKPLPLTAAAAATAVAATATGMRQQKRRF